MHFCIKLSMVCYTYTTINYAGHFQHLITRLEELFLFKENVCQHDMNLVYFHFSVP